MRATPRLLPTAYIKLSRRATRLPALALSYYTIREQRAERAKREQRYTLLPYSFLYLNK